jgi:anthranilate phosphoribosyltransferase
MRHAGPVRKELGIPTIMNFLGPLSNPARAEAQVVGVSDPAMAPKMVEVLRGLAKKRAMVVHGLDGLDEITTTTRTLVHELEGDDVRVYEIDPADLGLAVAAPDTLRGGDVRRNQAVAEEVLAGRRGPARDVVALNAAAGCVVGGLAGDLREGLDLAFAVLDDGRAASAIEVLAAASRAAGVT